MQPGARRTEVAGLRGDRLKIRIAARAVDGAANRALVEFLADALGAPRRGVAIQAGETSRQKRMSVLGARRAPETLLSA